MYEAILARPRAWLNPRIALHAVLLTALACHAAPAFAQGIPAAAATDSSQPPLMEILVEGARRGGADDGYRAGSVSVGPLGALPLQDTPFSINVVSSDLIENLQASSASDALRYDATIRPTLGSNLSSNYFMIRGFIVNPFGTTASAATDGMRASVLFEPVEDKDRIEVMNGPASFLYGFASPGGLVNYVLKRPTTTPVANVTVGDYGGEQAYIRGDFGGRLNDDGTLAYRLNLLGVDKGDVGVAHESNERYLVSGALDWHIAPDTLWSFDISYFRRMIDYQQAIFQEGSVTRIPQAPDLSKNYGAPYNFTKDSFTKYGTELTSKIDDVFSVRAAFRYTQTENASLNIRDNWINNNGDYNFLMQAKGTNQIATTQGYAFLDTTFETGPFKHTLTVGLAEDYAEGRTIYPNGSTTFTFPARIVSTIADPTYPQNPYDLVPIDGPLRITEQTTLRTVIAADRIALGQSWSLLIGGNFPSIDDKNLNVNTGVFASEYKTSRVSPAAALTYKPMPSLSLYASYIEALQAGPTAPAGTANQNEVLAPFTGKQVELGAKATLGHMDLDAAVFRIEKPNAYTDPATLVYSLNGQEVHTGGEVTLTGKLTDALTLIGGFTILDAKVTKTSTPSLLNKTPLGVPDLLASLYAEYALPRVPGLTLSGGVSYTGKEWVNSPNTLSIPSVILASIGLRYRTRISNAPVTFRLDVNNLNGEDYWTSKGDTLIYPGNPRTAAFSVEVGL
jgi:iron complex outermembrane receptor protein